MLAGAALKIKDRSPKEGMEDGLLERGNDVRMDSGIHEAILDGISLFSEGEIGMCDLYLVIDDGGCIFTVMVWRGKNV
jgi:hypothetical protein